MTAVTEPVPHAKSKLFNARIRPNVTENADARSASSAKAAETADRALSSVVWSLPRSGLITPSRPEGSSRLPAEPQPEEPSLRVRQRAARYESWHDPERST